MADVNPNQDLRFKEIMRRMLPGSYIMLFVYVSCKLTEFSMSSFGQKLMNLTDGMGDWVRFSFLMVAVYFIGYVVNILASLMERKIVYKIFKIHRPSRDILNGDGHYQVSNPKRIIKEAGVKTDTSGKVAQRQAFEVLRYVKSQISRRDNLVEDMYYQCIMARNLLCAHLIANVVFFIFCDVDRCCARCIFLLTSALLLVLFWHEWRRKNFVYVRNVFEEYLKRNKVSKFAK